MGLLHCFNVSFKIISMWPIYSCHWAYFTISRKPKSFPLRNDNNANSLDESRNASEVNISIFITMARNGGVLWVIADTWSDRTSSNLFERKSDFKTTQAIVYYGINTKSICFDLGENEIEWNTYDCYSTESNQDHVHRMSDDNNNNKKG